MVKSKVAIVVLLVCVVMMAAVLMVEMDKTKLLKEMKVALKSDDYCCQIYRNPMIVYMCSGAIKIKDTTNLTTNTPTLLPSSHAFLSDQSDLNTT